MFQVALLVWERLGSLLIALKQLYRGKLEEGPLLSFKEEWRSLAKGEVTCWFPVLWEDASAETKRAVRRLEEAVRRYLGVLSPLRGAAALSRLLGSPTGGYGTELGTGASGIPARGQTIAMRIEDLALPLSRIRGVRVAEMSPRVAKVFLDPLRTMLRPEEEAKEMKSLVRRFQDPILNRAGALLQLLLRLHQGGMIVACATCIETVNFFSVVKKLTPVGMIPRRKGGPSRPQAARSGSSGVSGSSSSVEVPDVIFEPEKLTAEYAVDELGVVWQISQRLIMDERAGNGW
jgi:hypothetical protein